MWSVFTKLSRFKSLFLSLLAFLLLIAVVLLTNYFVSNQVERDSGIIDAAGEMSDQFYNLALDIQQLSIVPDDERQDIIEQTIEAQQEINTLMLLLDTGGRYDYGDGSYIDVAPVSSETSLEALEQLHEIWNDYQVKLMPVVSSDASTVNGGISLAQFAFDNKDTIYETIDMIYVDRFDNSQYWVALAKYVLIGGMVIAVLYFAWFVFYFMRKLLHSENKLQESRQQTQDILSTINEGLFLVDKDLVIAGQYSDRLESLMQTRDIAGRKMTQLLKNNISAEDLENTQDFVEQLYSPWVVEELIGDLNPLKRIKVASKNEDGQPQFRYLDFNFMRVMKQEEVDRVLVSVRDVSEAVHLEQQLSKEQAQNSRQMQMISNLLSVDAKLLNQFMMTTYQRLNNINDILKKSGSKATMMQKKAQEIFRQVHSLKGEASALKLTTFVDLAHQTEEQVKPLMHKEDVMGNDFLSMAVSIDSLFELTQFVERLAKQLNLSVETTTPHTSIGTDTGTVNTKIQQISSTSTNNSVSTQDFGSKTELDGGDEMSSSDEELYGQENIRQVVPMSEVEVDEAQTSSSSLPAHFASFVQDIASRHHKQAQLVCSNWDDVYLSDSLALSIQDISTQLLRNSVVHGIELPQVREQLGKPVIGTVTLELKHEPDSHTVLLSCMDDGQGLNLKNMIKSAVANGILTQQQAQSLTKKEALNLMFYAGVSTASSTNEDAGQGMGMDVIKAQVQRLGGKMSGHSKLGQFTKFEIRIPLS
ncbi:Hpt domain-containing protein [Psychrobacter sp. I-STPA6b]|uniref:Hpt domain-containing protein n=1 Tax=Psychrobacter sp. I-STPA6b TaxID=2585718 RepID=UPI001D0CB824|nr:Hpt domain-containing protein [Psychrobacter sp. I-STPA6b]